MISFVKLILERPSRLTGLLARYPFGRLLFLASLTVKKLSLSFGGQSQRAVEYPWVMKNLRLIRDGNLVLDVGCAESLLSYELLAHDLRVVGVDLRDCLFRDKRVAFVKENLLNSRLPNDFFDAIVVVSTIEHIGLEPYGQTVNDSDGDLKVMDEFERILKPSGIIILTTPYIGEGPLRLNAFEREYNSARLTELTKNFTIVADAYFYPVNCGKNLKWLNFSRENIDSIVFGEDSGVACLVLKKAAT